MKVYILGAGMSALATAERLLESGIKEVILIEQDNLPGGVSRSFSWGGFDYNDLGPHIWHTPNEKLSKNWEDRFGELFFKGKFWGKNVLGNPPGEYIDYPLSYETILNFENELREKIKVELSQLTKEALVKASSFEQYVKALVGPTLAQMFFKDYPEKLWGVSTSKMTANWAPKRINFTEKPEEFHGKQWSAIGRYGSGGIINVMVSNIVAMGGVFLYNSKITNLVLNQKVIEKIEINHKDLININKEDKIISTIPFNYFANLLNIKNDLSYRGALLVYCSIAKPVVIPGNAAFLYFSQPDVPFHRISEQKKFCNLDWPKKKTTVVAEIAFNEEDLTNLDEDRLVSETIASLIRYGFISNNQLLDTKSVKLPNVYPLLTQEKEVEYKSVLSKIQDFLQVYLIGTGGEYHYADLQILYTKGRDLADRIINEKFRSQIANNNIESKILIDTFFPQEPFVIAEIGLNHGGSVEISKELLRKAKQSGVKYVKFQTYKSEHRISKVYRTNNYFEELIDTEENLFSMFQKYEFSKNDWEIIFNYGNDLGLKVFSAVFDSESLNLLESIGCPAYKIASMDLNNYPLIELIAKTGKPIILSTGMSTLGEIERAIQIIESYSPTEFIILHCISSYPASLDSLNLNAIKTLETAFGRPVGFSDHTMGSEAAIVAISIGAICVEKHFTLDHNLEGPDHRFSLTPSEMKYLVKTVQSIPSMLGNSSRILTAQEVETSYKFKKSIHASRNLVKGEILKINDISIKGPYGGIAPEHLDFIIGRELKRDIEYDFPITWECL